MTIDVTRSFNPVSIAVLTVSDTRTLGDDRSGNRLVELLEAGGHRLVSRSIVRDDCDAIVTVLREHITNPDIDCVITTGGTGMTGRDVTPEALQQLGGKPIPGFGELFRWLSFQKIGTSTIQSRACAIVTEGTFVFALPGSTSAVEDGWDWILSTQLDNRYRPCNFVELMPRLREI